jgi:hypothetical protein
VGGAAKVLNSIPWPSVLQSDHPKDRRSMNNTSRPWAAPAWRPSP